MRRSSSGTNPLCAGMGGILGRVLRMKSNYSNIFVFCVTYVLGVLSVLYVYVCDVCV